MTTTDPGTSSRRAGLLALLAAVWVVWHGLLLLLAHESQRWVTGDVGYFRQSIELLGSSGVGRTLTEYPVPAVGVLWVPSRLAHLGGSYTFWFFALVLVTDLAFAVLLWWETRGRSLLPLVVWVVGIPLLGTTALARFDLLPGVLVGATVLMLARRPAVAGVLAALATGVKLWPALFIPALLGVRRTRGRILAGVAVTGVVLLGVSLVLGGWGRLFSPLTYQFHRGLQVESVPATPAMLGRALSPERWQVTYAASRSYEVTGPGVHLLLALSTVAALVYVALVVAAWARVAMLARAGRDVGLCTTVWVVLATVSGFIVVGKVFSPQYLLWLLPAVAAALVVVDHTALRVWAAALLGAELLTNLVFPLNYLPIVQSTAPHLHSVTLLLAARNLLVAAMFVVAVVRAWRGLSAVGRSPANRPARSAGESASSVVGAPTPSAGAAARPARRRPPGPAGPRSARRPPRGSRRP